MREAGRIVAEISRACRAAVRPGVTTGELDARRARSKRRGAAPTSWATACRCSRRSRGHLHLRQRGGRPRHPG